MVNDVLAIFSSQLDFKLIFRSSLRPYQAKVADLVPYGLAT